MTKPQFKNIPVTDLTVSLEDFQGRAEAYSSVTYNRIARDVAEGTFNPSAMPPIMVWKDIRTGQWVILGGHSRTAIFSDLSKGKLPMASKYKPSDFAEIHAQVFIADSKEDALQQAKKVAQESNLAGQQSDIDFAFKVVKPMRENLKGNKYWEKMEDLFGANKMAVHKLSFLNPDGKAVSMIRATKDLSDRQQRATVETIAEYIGRARERMPELTNAHENELYDWLTKVWAEEAKAKKEGRQLNSQISSETKFLELIGSRVMRLGWTPDQPLNLELLGTKSVYQRNFDEERAAKEKQIKDLQQAYNEQKQKLVNLQWPTEKIEEQLDTQEKYIIRLQKDLAKYLQGYGQVEEATKNELSLFDMPAPPASAPAASSPVQVVDKDDYKEKLEKLLSLLRVNSSPLDLRIPDKKAEIIELDLSDSDFDSLANKISSQPKEQIHGIFEYAGNQYLLVAGIWNNGHYQSITAHKIISGKAFSHKGNKFDIDAGQVLFIKKNHSDIAVSSTAEPITIETVYGVKLGVLREKENGAFLISQLAYWLNEFEFKMASGAERFSAYKFEGDNYDPHIIREKTGYTDVDMLKQICETAIHVFADKLIKDAKNDLEAFDKLCAFYKIQPKVEWRSSKSMRLQQYSTPVPIAFLMSKFCIPAPVFGDKYLEPSAGTGLLTIGTPPAYWTVNEIDKDRLLCMRAMGFDKTYSYDGTMPLPFGKEFDAVITNPPFNAFGITLFDGYKIKKKEFVMAAYALKCMKDTGKAAIIVGDYMKYDAEGYIYTYATDGVFFNYLYHTYNVVDVISLDGSMYKAMGANAPIRIILIDGKRNSKEIVLPPRFQEIQDLPSDTTGSPHKVKSFSTLAHRFGLYKK